MCQAAQRAAAGNRGMEPGEAVVRHLFLPVQAVGQAPPATSQGAVETMRRQKARG